MSRQACMRCYRRRVLERVYAEPSGYERWLCRRCQIAHNLEVASLRGFVTTSWRGTREPELEFEREPEDAP